MGISWSRDPQGFQHQDIRFTTTKPTSEVPSEKGVLIKYFIHGHGVDKSALCGYAVVSTDGLCPTFKAGSNQNMLQHLFGIKFHYDDHTHVRGISPFKFA